jgi:dephospho-CoA kinase
LAWISLAAGFRLGSFEAAQMILIGLTGGVGMGKSTTASFLERLGVPVIDTDLLARQIVEPGQPALADVQRAFGHQVVGPDGRLRREEVARIVFANDTKRRQLEAILHPRIRELWLAQVAVWRAEHRALGAVVIPLLFETDAAKEFDVILCTACTAGTQRRRLEARGWSAVQIEQRIAAQWPAQKKMDLSRFVVWTEPPLEVHAAQVGRVVESVATGRTSQ